MASNKQQGKQQKLTAKQKGERVRAAQEREARAKEQREKRRAHQEDIHHRGVRHPGAGAGHSHHGPGRAGRLVDAWRPSFCRYVRVPAGRRRAGRPPAPVARPWRPHPSSQRSRSPLGGGTPACALSLSGKRVCVYNWLVCRAVYANINRLLRERRGDRMDMTDRPHKGDYFVWYRWSSSCSSFCCSGSSFSDPTSCQPWQRR